VVDGRTEDDIRACSTRTKENLKHMVSFELHLGEDNRGLENARCRKGTTEDNASGDVSERRQHAGPTQRGREKAEGTSNDNNKEGRKAYQYVFVVKFHKHNSE
jgi:hypothetical protein